MQWGNTHNSAENKMNAKKLEYFRMAFFVTSLVTITGWLGMVTYSVIAPAIILFIFVFSAIINDFLVISIESCD